MRKYTCRGMIQLRMLIAVFTISLMIPIVYQSFEIAANMKLSDEVVQDEISTYQLRKKLLLVDDIEVYDKEIFFDYDNNRWHLYLSNNHLLLSPGSQLFYLNIDDIGFQLRDTVLYLYYKRAEETKYRVIANVY